MDSGRIRFFLSEVLRNFTRNLIMQFTAIGTVAVTIVLLGSFLFTRQTLGAIGDDVIKKIEISVFLTDRSTPGDARALVTRLRADRRIASVVYVPRAEGLREMRERLRGQIDTSLLTTNPLPDALRVRAVDPERVHEVAAFVAKQPNVAHVEYAQDAVEKLLRITAVLGRIGFGIVGLLVFTAAIIISNTIRLTVFARRREIAIMQLVGASGFYIRMPFIFEGLIAGLLGAAIALALLVVARVELLPKIVVALPFLPMHAANIDGLTFAAELLATGATVGTVAAWLSVGRYLRA
jgi:cell division transport system permease protein